MSQAAQHEKERESESKVARGAQAYVFEGESWAKPLGQGPCPGDEDISVHDDGWLTRETFVRELPHECVGAARRSGLQPTSRGNGGDDGLRRAQALRGHGSRCDSRHPTHQTTDGRPTRRVVPRESLEGTEAPVESFTPRFPFRIDRTLQSLPSLDLRDHSDAALLLGELLRLGEDFLGDTEDSVAPKRARREERKEEGAE